MVLKRLAIISTLVVVFIFLFVFLRNYQELKLVTVSILLLTKDAIHIYVGFMAFLISVLVLRLSPRSYKALLLGLIVAILMEVLDLRDNFLDNTYFRWGDSFHDILNASVIPVTIVVLMRSNLLTSNPKEG